jgi:hypothetical protein
MSKSYIRSDDGATMVEVEPHQYVNAKILRLQGRLTDSPKPQPTPELKVYCDTNTLPGNVEACETESDALKQLQSIEGLKWFTSHIVGHEASGTKDEGKRNRLLGEHQKRERIAKDEKVVGNNVQSGPHGFISFFLISDVQNEALRSELMGTGLTQRDAEHIAQAVSNDCDVFLTRDKKSIIRPHRAWLENRFPSLRVRLPSELLSDLTPPEGQ